MQAALRQYESMLSPTSKPTAVSKCPYTYDRQKRQQTQAPWCLEVEQGGIVVPSFAGKSVRAAVELAQSNSLDLDIVGSGLGMEQSPAAGSHVAAGSRVVVKFGRINYCRCQNPRGAINSLQTLPYNSLR